MSPGAEDGSPSSGPGVDRETSSIMADEKIERASTDEKSPARSGVESKPAPKSNPKDPSRPRRKKARRACFACQRAHLTCGDERPCLRCIKRGLQDQCHDGVRKKAKYLHDAPPEALMPGFPPNQFSTNGSQNAPPVTANNQITQNGISISQPPNFMPQTSSSNFPQFSPVNHGGRMAAPMIEGNDPMLGGNFGGPQQNVETPSQYQSTPTQQTSPVQTIPGSIDQPPTIETSRGQSYDQSFMDPNDPSLFNFDISGLNFGNHYGALEFGMLGHMSSGAVGTPDVDLSSIGNQSHHNSMSYDNTSGFNSGNNFNMNQFSGWPGLQRQSSNNNIWTASSNGMDAFAIGEASLTGQSPASQNLDFNSNYQSGGTMSPENQFAQVDQSQQQSQDLLRQSFSQPTPQQPRKQVPPFNGGGHPRKRRRDISEIYTSVTAPYPYTQGFHALTAFLQKRFPSKKTLRIAKALASIRPSFISCNKNLGHEDLIFMEKCFQRTLCEYEDFVNHYGTPTIICRRTGEIAAVSKEFSLVTGWRRDVLLGKEANLNINTGSNNSGTQTGTSSRGAVTPRAPVDIDPGRPQPVFLAEIMDEDSVVQFYEDFAELAFGASRASIIGPTVSLLKYKTKDDPGWGANDFGGSGDDGKRGRSSSGDVKMEPLMKGDAGTKALGDRDGRVDCSMCWTVKRDVFDIPMLIVMNFLPII